MTPLVFLKISKIFPFKLHSLMYKCEIETDFLNAKDSTAAHLVLIFIWDISKCSIFFAVLAIKLAICKQVDSDTILA